MAKHVFSIGWHPCPAYIPIKTPISETFPSGESRCHITNGPMFESLSELLQENLSIFSIALWMQQRGGRINRWGKLVTVRQCFNAVVKVVAASPSKDHGRHSSLSVAYR